MQTSASVKFNFEDLNHLSPEQLFNLMTAVHLYLTGGDDNNAEIKRLTVDRDVRESFGQYRRRIDRSRRNAARRAERRALAGDDRMVAMVSAEVERLDRLSNSLSNVRGDQIRFMFRQFIAETKQIYLERLRHKKARN